MKKLDFIRQLVKQPKVVAESKSYEDLLFSRLEKQVTILESERDPQDHVAFDIPLLIRVFELVREDVKSDMDLHNLVERLIAIKDRGVLTMDDYEAISSAQSSKDSGQVTKRSTESLDIDMIRHLSGLGKK